MSQFAQTPQPPYYAVIFTSQRTEGDNGYEQMAADALPRPAAAWFSQGGKREFPKR